MQDRYHTDFCFFFIFNYIPFLIGSLFYLGVYDDIQGYSWAKEQTPPVGLRTPAF